MASDVDDYIKICSPAVVDICSVPDIFRVGDIGGGVMVAESL